MRPVTICRGTVRSGRFSQIPHSASQVQLTLDVFLSDAQLLRNPLFSPFGNSSVTPVALSGGNGSTNAGAAADTSGSSGGGGVGASPSSGDSGGGGAGSGSPAHGGPSDPVSDAPRAVPSAPSANPRLASN